MLDIVIDQRRRSLGGFDVGRVLPFAQRRMVGPFVFFDHMGPVDFPRGIGREFDVRPHPHIGLSTITYLFEGEIMHRDSVGSEQAIRPAEVNWMVAGRGITHSERFEKARAEGGRMHGIQSWVALPQDDEETEPGFAHHGHDDLPVAGEHGISFRILAGEAYGVRANVKMHSPMFYVHADVPGDKTIALPDNYSERAIFVVTGEIECEARSFASGQLLVFAANSPASVEARTCCTLMLLGGEPVGPRFVEWNFVSSSKERIEQAKADWRAGRMKLPDLDNKEFIPLPPDPPATA
jgi:redox-sensitive bicupin YhaK (pirin superfamily)